MKARIEAEQRLVEANAKSTKQLRDRVAKLLTNAYECLDKVCCPALSCPALLYFLSSDALPVTRLQPACRCASEPFDGLPGGTSAACLPLHEGTCLRLG